MSLKSILLATIIYIVFINSCNVNSVSITGKELDSIEVVKPFLQFGNFDSCAVKIAVGQMSGTEFEPSFFYDGNGLSRQIEIEDTSYSVAYTVKNSYGGWSLWCVVYYSYSFKNNKKYTITYKKGKEIGNETVGIFCQ